MLLNSCSADEPIPEKDMIVFIIFNVIIFYTAHKASVIKQGLLVNSYRQTERMMH